jgi:hypothetical protein
MTGNRDGFAGGIGRWTRGDVFSDKAGNLTDARTGGAVAAPDAKAGGGKPSPTKDDQAHIEPGDLDAELDAEDARRAGQLRKLGVEGGEPAEPKKVPGAVDIAARLAEIRAMRRSDERRYWSKEIQDEELALIRASADGKPAGSAAEESGEEGAAETGADAELADVERELGALRTARKESRTGVLSAEQERRELKLLDRREVLEAGASQMSPELVERWRQDGGLAANMERAVGIAARAGVAAFEEVAQAVDNLPDGLAVEVTDQLRLDWPAVRGTEEHRREVAAARLDEIISAAERTHGARAGQAIEDAVAKLSPAARAGIVRMLAGG